MIDISLLVVSFKPASSVALDSNVSILFICIPSQDMDMWKFAWHVLFLASCCVMLPRCDVQEKQILTNGPPAPL